MRPLLGLLSRSDSFSELWPQLAASAGAELCPGVDVADLGDLTRFCALLVGAGGVEHTLYAQLADLQARGAPRVCVVGTATDHRLIIGILHAGADDYFALPADLGEMRAWVVERVERVHEAQRVRQLAEQHRQRFDFSRILGRSPCLVSALERAARVIPRSDATVLISGETGTGKDLLAKAIHFNGPRSTRPFVEINCAALPENLLEAELFGYEAGAFTDARAPKPGLLEVAAGGTLFLDEIGEMSPMLQAKLLRALEEKRTRRLGGVRSVDLDLRIVAATHVHLPDAVREGRFRQDLYYRLNVVPIRLPALRERGDDIILLTRHFLEYFGRHYDLPVLPLSPDLQRVLLAHHWPGNVRELRNAIERAVLLGDGQRLDPADLFPDEPSTGNAPGVLPFPAPLDQIECAAARAMLDQCGGNKSRAAERLGISRKYLYELLARGER